MIRIFNIYLKLALVTPPILEPISNQSCRKSQSNVQKKIDQFAIDDNFIRVVRFIPTM